MIILDTNVISELMRVEAAPPVKSWFHSHSLATLSTTAITVAEILRGIQRLPDSGRRRGLQDRFDLLLELGFRDRILAFDRSAADSYASLVTKRMLLGRPIGVLDAMIAAIALSVGADIATRDVNDFSDSGLRIVNPWG